MAKVVLITSGAKGLGHSTVLTLAKCGWDVAFTYGKSQQEAVSLASRVEATGQRALPIHCDLFSRDSIQSAVSAAKGALGGIDAVVHNFGPFVFERRPLADYDDDMWRQMMDGNLTNFFWLYRATVHDMRARRFGRFVTIGYDGAGEARGWRYRAAYAAAKSGLAALTRSIAREERMYGITANMVCPGDIRGEDKMRMIEDVKDVRTEEGLRPPVGEDVARAVEWFLREEGQEVNGTVLEVTGAREILAKDSLPRRPEP